MTVIRIVDPPRAVPLGLGLRILAHRDVTGSMFFLLPAAVALVAAVASPGTGIRVSLVSAGLLFLLQGLKTALPALFRSLATLQRMRFGFVTMGRIVSCHLAWDGKREEKPYREFLENWTVNVARSQMGKAMGCLGVIVVALFVVPLALMMLTAVAVLAFNFLQHPEGTAMAGDVDGATIAKFVAMGLVFIAMLFLFLRASRRSAVDAVAPYMEWRRLAQPGKDAVYDEHAKQLVELAKQRGERISLKEPLPANDSGVELVCKVDYSAMGEPCTAAGRARLSNRLDPAGVERLIFSNLERGRIDLFAGLPDEASIDAQGRWAEVPAAGSAAQLALTGTAAVVAIAALLWNVFLLRGILE
jgi:hypothetical protein